GGDARGVLEVPLRRGVRRRRLRTVALSAPPPGPGDLAGLRPRGDCGSADGARSGALEEGGEGPSRADRRIGGALKRNKPFVSLQGPVTIQTVCFVTSG